MNSVERVLCVDDAPENLELLETILSRHGYTVLRASSGEEALTKTANEEPDLVLLDVVMPGMDGYEVCRRLRGKTATRVLPVIMVTASGNQEKVRAIEAGADDFIQKPLDQAELLARVRSLLRVKRFHDELTELNRTLEARVREQVAELERVGRLRRFLAPQIADLLLAEGEADFLETHRREVTAVFCDLRGFTAFAETTEPEEVINVLRDYHRVVGNLAVQFEATLDHFAGDGVLVFFNDPVPCDEPALRAIRFALAVRGQVSGLVEAWRERGHDLDFGIGIALGHATLGTIGSDGMAHYAAIGTVTNLASRLSDAADKGQILVSARVRAETEQSVECEPVGPFELKGLSRPVAVFNVLGLRAG